MIDRENVIENLEKNIRWIEDVTMAIRDAVKLLIEQEANHGQWVQLTGMAPPEYHGHKICSMCGGFAPYDPIHMGREILPKYCPNCGAKMEAECDD